MARGSKDYFSMPIFPAYGTQIYDTTPIAINIGQTQNVFSVSGKGIINFIRLEYYQIGANCFPSTIIAGLLEDQFIFGEYISMGNFMTYKFFDNKILKCVSYSQNVKKIYFELFFNQQFSSSAEIRLTNNDVVAIEGYCTSLVQFIV